MIITGQNTHPWGLLLAGGHSRRMGHDKALLRRADGRSWLEHGASLLSQVCEQVVVSARKGQLRAALREYPLVADRYRDIGPAAGLLSAWDRYPSRAWLVLATDMPRVEIPLLTGLLEGRAAGAVATAYRGPDGLPEPLCALWEPAAEMPLRAAVMAGKRSLRRLLQDLPVNWLEAPDPAQLVSANTPAQARAVFD